MLKDYFSGGLSFHKRSIKLYSGWVRHCGREGFSIFFYYHGILGSYRRVGCIAQVSCVKKSAMVFVSSSLSEANISSRDMIYGERKLYPSVILDLE